MNGKAPSAEPMEPRREIPADVAALYAWANLRDARYRDFSALRRELRAEGRLRAAQAQRETQASARLRAEQAAQEAELGAMQAWQAARFHEAQLRRAVGQPSSQELLRERAAREESRRQALALTQLAIQERAQADHLAAAGETAAALARSEAQEAAEAHVSAERQAQRYAGSAVLPGFAGIEETQITQRQLESAARTHTEPAPALDSESEMQPQRFRQRRSPYGLPPRVSLFPDVSAHPESEAHPNEGFAAEPSKAVSAASCTPTSRDDLSQRGGDAKDAEGVASLAVRNAAPSQDQVGPPLGGFALPFVLPAWIEQNSSRAAGEVLPRQISVALSPTLGELDEEPGIETLQRSRELGAARWYALRGLFDPSAPDME